MTVDSDGGSTTELVMREWMTPVNNFDNIFQAFKTVFVMGSEESWPGVMYNALDVTDVDEQPRRNASPWNALFFLAFIPIGGWLMVGLFIGALVDQFNKVRLEENVGASLFLTEGQQKFIQLQKVMMSVGISGYGKPPKWKIRRFFWWIITKENFDRFILVVVVLNVLVLVTDHYDEPDALDTVQFWTDIAFTLVYIMEVVFKLIALFPLRYFRSVWNILDFVIVVFAVVGAFFTLGSSIAVLKVLRVVKLFKIFRVARKLRILFRTLILSLPAVLNIGFVLFIVFFIYAILGTNFFNEVTSGTILNDDNVNFTNVAYSFFMLVRMATGESWDVIMSDVQEARGNWVVIYFVSFVTLSTFLGLNLFVAVVLENFQFVSELEDSGNLSVDNLEDYSALWGKYDEDKTGFMRVADLPRFLQELKKPLGFGEVSTELQLRSKIVPIERRDFGADEVADEQVFFPDLLLVLTQHMFEDAEMVVLDEVKKHWRKAMARQGGRWKDRMKGMGKTTSSIDLRRSKQDLKITVDKIETYVNAIETILTDDASATKTSSRHKKKKPKI
eukprot:TRINITY_DN8296_c0_g1_i2.p1 TRINITY_DN8296_c0_g1~~TRINITY_DN8296_c0_g1_i2.p1  ORF type:complete len:559 (+),score=91.11 TRINITY_DN8296_c0_g1_i2:693-2369(+)